MKKLLYLLPAVVLLAAACNSSKPVEQKQPPAYNQQTQTAPPPAGTQQTNLEVVYPSGGESLSLNSTVIIKYQISDAFKSQLGSNTITEMYLVDKNNVVIGYIGEVNTSLQTLNWKPTELRHWAGLDIITTAPKAGEYKILLVSRQKTPSANTGGDYPIDIYTDLYTKVQGDAIANTGDGTTKLKTLSFVVSEGTFTLK